jgi:hypothetical protein
MLKMYNLSDIRQRIRSDYARNGTNVSVGMYIRKQLNGTGKLVLIKVAQIPLHCMFKRSWLRHYATSRKVEG